MKKHKVKCLITSTMVFASLFSSTVITKAEVTSNTSQQNATTTTNQLTLNDMPSNLKSSIEWVWNNRILKEGSTKRKNLIFDQIYAGKGTLNYIVRWQSNKSVTLQQRKDMATMISRQINNWTKSLKGYDGWPYGDITVKIVGWACADPSLILNKQSDEIVYTSYITDDLSTTDSSIPTKLPIAPSSISRFDHFQDSNYSYPGGLDKRFDMYLWGTSNLRGGAGGDWGQRVSDEYILSSLASNEAHIIEHEIGHAFSITDFYEDADRPPGGFPTNTIMWAGDSMTITEWDSWMLRYVWSQIKKDTSRFPATIPVETTYKLGDVNKDGKITALDLAFMKKLILNGTNEADLTLYDMNKDGKFNALDLVTLKRLLLS